MIALLFIIQTLRIAVPYLFAAMGGVISEKAGLIALSLEGYMLAGAFCAALGAYYTESAWIGVLAGMAGGFTMAMIYSIATVRFRADQVVSGTWQGIYLCEHRDRGGPRRLTLTLNGE